AILRIRVHHDEGHPGRARSHQEVVARRGRQVNIVSHLEKIRRLEALRARLDPLDDFALWFWSAMNCGTHAVNAALHDAGITRADDVYPMQPGVYLVPQTSGEAQPC